MFVHKICNKIPQLNFQRRLVLQQPVDFPVDTVYPYRYLLQRAADIAQAQQMLRAARCCRSACVSADSAGAHPAAAARARRPARQIAVSPPASPAACWWQNHRPARLRLPGLKTVEHHAVGKELEIIQRQDTTPAALTAADITVGLQQIIRLFHRGDVDLVFAAHKPIRRQRLAGRDLAGEDLCAQLRIDLLIQALCAVADYAHTQNPDCLVIVDNTFSTPLLVQPLKLGADVVVHSATKYLNGHGDVVAGFSAARKEIMDQIRMVRLKDITGAMLGPQEAFLILRGLKTLKVRMDAVCANTQKVVDFLAGSKYVQKVFYPSLENHPDHAVAVREMTRFGGVVSFEMGSFEEAKKVLNHVHLCAGRQPWRLRDAHPASGFHDALHVHERRDQDRRLLGSPDPSGSRSGRHRYIIADLQQAFEAVQN